MWDGYIKDDSRDSEIKDLIKETKKLRKKLKNLKKENKKLTYKIKHKN